MNTAEIRQRFVGYYSNMGYLSLPSAPMLDPSIPMSFVMSAGLVQVENSLAKTTKRAGSQYVLVQNCFRHFDLEKVGTDDIHLSLFQMPGAFVFGADGKAGTIRKMWTLATSVMGLEKNNIWISYFKGGTVAGNNLAEDTVTRQAWVDLDIPENHIVGFGIENNYWIQGKGIEDTSTERKCGPNTELFYELTYKKACGNNCRPGCKCGRFVEFSNSLFICSEISQNDLSMRPLENPFTETVVGAERVSMIRQKISSVFGIEEFDHIMSIIQSLARVNNLPEAWVLSSKRVIADHLRGLFYLIADGAPPPGKNGRERIIKILIRRVITSLFILDINIRQYIPILVASVANLLSDEIDRKNQTSNSLTAYFLEEFERFMRTIQQGKHKLFQILKENNGKTLSGSQILYLEKKWGLPIQMTALALQDQGLSFEEIEYKTALYSFKNKQENDILRGGQNA